MLGDPSEVLILAVNVALLAWVYGTNRLSIAVFDHQRRSGRDPFLYQVAMTRSDIRLLLIGTPIILQQLLLSAEEVRMDWLNLWMMQLGLTLVMGTQLESSLLLSLSSLDRWRALRSTGAPYFKHPSYKVLSSDTEKREKHEEAVEPLTKRRLRSCLVAGYTVVGLVYLACVYEESQRSRPRGILPRCLAIHLLPPALRTQQMGAEVCNGLRSPGIPGVPSYGGMPVERMKFYPSTYPALVVILIGSVFVSALFCALFVATFARTIKASAKTPRRHDAKALGARKMAAVLVSELSFVLLGIASLALVGAYGDSLETSVAATLTAFINLITLQSNFFSFFALSRTFRKDMWNIVKVTITGEE